MTFDKCSHHKNTGQYRERQKNFTSICIYIYKINVLEATNIQSENKVDKFNVNKHLFCVKKGKICNIFKFIQ